MDKAFNLVDHQITVIGGTALSLQGGPTDLTQYFNTASAAPINSKQADEVEILVDPVVQWADTPVAASDAGINLPVTEATASSVKLRLDTDRYTKPTVDRLATLNTASLQALGRSIGKGLIREGNTRLLRAAVTGAPQVALTGTTAQSTWTQLNDQAAAFEEAGFDMSDFTLVISSTELRRFQDDVKVLGTQVDAKTRAAELLGIGRVVIAKPGSYTVEGETVNGVAVLGHRGTLAVAKRVDEVRFREGDASDYAVVRIKTGADVLDDSAIVVFTR